MTKPATTLAAWFLVATEATSIALFAAPACAAAEPRDGVTAPAADAARVSRYNVVWTRPSQDATGVMPLGNGDIAAGVYAIEEGDLYLLLAKNDAFNYQGEIYKTGRVRVSLDPNPFRRGKPFRQVLDLATGSIQITADGVELRVWADANHPLFHVEVNAPREIAVTARPEFWKRLDGTPDVCVERAGKLLWYFAVGDRSVYPEDLKYYQVESMARKFSDPYRFNTFGHLLESPELSHANHALCGKGKHFDLRIHALAKQEPEPSRWIKQLLRQAARPVNTGTDWEAHRRWWEAFWNRGWIVASDNTLPLGEREKFTSEASASGRREEKDGAALAAQSYQVFRFVMACQSRGRVQAKFNGGLFTQQMRVINANGRLGAAQQPDGSWLTHEDDRLWGRRFTYQNQRLLYWPLLASGDTDLMRPFFDYYSRLLGMRQAITKAWFGHAGAYYRENIEPTGAERDCGKDGRPPRTKPGEKYEGWYHDYYFTSGLETLAMMLDYVAYTADATFRDRVMVPFAREVLLFFDLHYPRGADGKLRLEPAQVLETWWVAVNPAPDVAGLRFCLDELLALKVGTETDRVRWGKFRQEIPEITLTQIEGRPAIAPAQQWEKRSNAENGELYPVFPFRCYGLAQGSADLVAWTMKHRSNRDAFGSACWTQDQIHWAYAGRAREARDGLTRRFRVASPLCRFPLYGREGPDSCPDFDHFGAGAVALQRMLVQEAGDKILLLPAWPADWDVDFKLRLAGNTTVSGVVQKGKLQTWDIQPAKRRASVVLCPPQVVDPRVIMPANDHPLLVGSDQAGGSRFTGSFGRVTFFRTELPPSMIHDLADESPSAPVKAPLMIGSWVGLKAGDQLKIEPADLAKPFTFEAWIRPGENESGRVLDKITIGEADGFLLDTWPKLSLRLIVGDRERDLDGALKPGVWQHVAVVVGESLRLYVNGKAK